MSKLELRSLCRSYGGFPILEQLSLEVAAEERVAVLGPSGCGKTTLLRAIAGLDLPDAGEIWLDGQLVSRPGWGLAPHLRDLAMAFQTPALWPHMTVAAAIGFGLTHLDAHRARERVDEVLEELELRGLADRYPHQLSGGEARRAALARALAPRRSLLLLDEPLTHLNAELKERIVAYLQAYLGHTRPTLVVVTHDREEALALAERVVELPGREER